MFYTRRAGDKFYNRADIVNPDYIATDLTKDDAWHELDLSDIVGKSKSLVFIKTYLNTNVGDKYLKLRTNGYSNNTNIACCCTQVAEKTCTHTLIVFTDNAGKIEYSASVATWNTLTLAIRGWSK